MNIVTFKPEAQAGTDWIDTKWNAYSDNFKSDTNDGYIGKIVGNADDGPNGAYINKRYMVIPWYVDYDEFPEFKTMKEAKDFLRNLHKN